MRKNKTIIIFLAKFFATYFILFGVYSIYLNKTQQKSDIFSCAPITKVVANHTALLANTLGYDVKVQQNTNELSMRFEINGSYVSRIVEGCNAISIIILFLSFIIAFSGSLKATVLFGLFGSVMIYLVNIMRILGLSLMYYRFPRYQEFLHSLVFPAIIYGLTFILWITWVKYFSKINKNDTSKKN